MTDQERDATNKSGTPQTGGKNADYDKLIGEERMDVGKGEGAPEGVGGGTIPNVAQGSGTSPGGRATSNSTVSAGGTTGGGNPGGITTKERGTPTARDETMNSDPIMGVNDRADVEGQSPPPKP